MLNRISFLSLPLLTFASCASIHYVEQEVFVRHDKEADAFDLGLLYKGVQEGDAGLDRAVEAVQQMAAGRRHFMLIDWFLEIDLDAEEEEEPEDLPPEAEALAGYGEQAALLLYGLSTPDGERLDLHQRFRFPSAQQGLAGLNDALNAFARAIGNQEEELSEWEALALEHGRSGDTWLAFEAGGFLVRVPMSPRLAASSLHELLVTEAEGDRALLAGILAAADELRLEDNHLVLHFTPDADGWIRFTFTRADREYDPTLRSRIDLPLARSSADELRRRLTENSR